MLLDEYNLQEELIQKAVDSGKEIILICHDEPSASTRFDYSNINITHIISEHEHNPQNKILETKNIKGESLRKITVGTALQGMPGSEEIIPPVGYYLHMSDEEVTIEKVKGVFDEEYHQMAELFGLGTLENTQKATK